MTTLLKGAVAVSAAAFALLLLVPTAVRAASETAMAAPKAPAGGDGPGTPPKCDEAFLLAWYKRQVETDEADVATPEPLPDECWPNVRDLQVEAQFKEKP